MLTRTCQLVEQERGELRTLLVESEEQLESVRRQVLSLEVKGSALESDKLILKR